MGIQEKDISFAFYRGQGPGGQHRNKTENACKATHVPTGITACCDARKRTESKRGAIAELSKKVEAAFLANKEAEKKARRDEAIKDNTVIRTYNQKRGTVKDHRTGKTAPYKEILDGKLDLLR